VVEAVQFEEPVHVGSFLCFLLQAGKMPFEMRVRQFLERFA